MSKVSQAKGVFGAIVKGLSKAKKAPVTPTRALNAEEEARLAKEAAGMNIPTIGTLPNQLPPAEKLKTLEKFRKTFLSTKPRQAGTIAGGLLLAPPAAAFGGALTGLYGQYANMFGGGATAPEAMPIDYSQIYNPQTGLEQNYQMMRQSLLNQVPSGQAQLDRLQQFSALMGRGGGTGVSRGAGANIYDEQARAIREANAPSTATSSVVPVSGSVAAQADALVRQGATLNDYLGFMEKAAAAAGVKMDQNTRMQLYTMATNAYYKKVNEVEDALNKLDLQYLQAQTQLGSQPQYLIDQAAIEMAKQRQAAGGNQLPLEAYLSQQAKEYYRQLGQG